MREVLRVINRLLAVAGVALLIVAVIVLMIPAGGTIAATQFDRANICTAPPVDSSFSRAGLNELLSQAPAPDCGQSVVLPYRSAADGIPLTRSVVAH